MASWILVNDVAENMGRYDLPLSNQIVTSPPYWKQRDYGLGPAQLGLDKTPELFVSRLASIFDGVREHCHSSSTAFVNMGDSFFGSGGAGGDYGPEGKRAGQISQANKVLTRKTARKGESDLKPKDIVGVPWMLAFELRRRGWWLRADNNVTIWSKSHLMPQGAGDRPTISHEYVFQFGASQNYYFDSEHNTEPDALGGLRTMRSVWEFKTSKFKGGHYATFPLELPLRCIELGTSDHGVCLKCRAPYRRETVKTELSSFDRMKAEMGGFDGAQASQDLDMAKGKISGAQRSRGLGGQVATMSKTKRETTGWAPSCKCAKAVVVPATVLDPFSGAASTGEAALRLGRSYIGFEPNPKFIQIAAKRLRGLGVLGMDGTILKTA